MRRTLSQARFVAIVAAIAACGHARVIQRTQAGEVTGGTLELEGDHNKAMEQANEEMAAHCGPNNFTILQDGEEPAAPAATGAPRTGEARTPTVWRVHYQCGTGGAPVAGEPPAGLPPGEPSPRGRGPAPPPSR